MSRPTYEALLLDLDGTLIDDSEAIRPRVRSSLHGIAGRGTRVMIATGRSGEGAQPVIEELGLLEPALVYNGAGLYCPSERRLLHALTLPADILDRTLELARERGWMAMVQRPGEKLASPPASADQHRALRGLECLAIAPDWDLPREGVIRTTFFSSCHASSAELCAELEARAGPDCYTTHFPLSHLANHRGSPMQVVDLQPPCAGKAEALRVLSERWGIDPEAVVAVGDATNDIPMFEAAGLSVSMGQGMPEARAAADRVIGSNESDALAELVEELFPRAPRGG